LARVTTNGNPWLELTTGDPPTTVRYEPAPPPAEAVVPDFLRGPRTPPSKEPQYQGKPQYLELAVGPDGRRAWLVLDGDRLYLDRNANGDLTDDGGPGRDLGFSRLAGALLGEKPRGCNFLHDAVTDPDRGVTYPGLSVMAVLLPSGRAVVALCVRVADRVWMKAGLTDLFLSDDPRASQIVTINVSMLVVRLLLTELEAGKAADVVVRLGTPGVGAGSFATRSNGDFPKGVNPVGEYRFPGVADPVRVTFDRRGASELGVQDRFVGQLTVPREAGGGRLH
jgi:hypothetical protein